MIENIYSHIKKVRQFRIINHLVVESTGYSRICSMTSSSSTSWISIQHKRQYRWKSFTKIFKSCRKLMPTDPPIVFYLTRAKKSHYCPGLVDWKLQNDQSDICINCFQMNDNWKSSYSKARKRWGEKSKILTPFEFGCVKNVVLIHRNKWNGTYMIEK